MANWISGLPPQTQGVTTFPTGRWLEGFGPLSEPIPSGCIMNRMPFVPNLAQTPTPPPSLSSRTITPLYTLIPVTPDSTQLNPVPTMDYQEWENAFASQSMRLSSNESPFSSSAPVSSSSSVKHFEQQRDSTTNAHNSKEDWTREETNILIQFVHWLHANLTRFSSLRRAFDWLGDEHLPERSYLSMYRKYEKLISYSEVKKLPELQGKRKSLETADDFKPNPLLRLLPRTIPLKKRKQPDMFESPRGWSNGENSILIQFVKWVDEHQNRFPSQKEAFKWLKNKYFPTRTESAVMGQYRALLLTSEMVDFPNLKKANWVPGDIDFTPDLSTQSSSSTPPSKKRKQPGKPKTPHKTPRWSPKETSVLTQFIHWLHDNPGHFSSQKEAFIWLRDAWFSKKTEKAIFPKRSEEAIRIRYDFLRLKGVVQPLSRLEKRDDVSSEIDFIPDLGVL